MDEKIKIPKRIEKTINTALLKFGFKFKLKGCNYIKYAIYLALCDDEALYNVGKNIYAVIGENCNTSSSAVERNITFAIKKAFSQNENTFFGKTPSNCEFLILFYNYVTGRGVIN